MIQINLLPNDLRPVKRTPLPYIVAIGLLVASVVIVMMMFFESLGAVTKKQNLIAGKESQLEKLAPVVQEFEELTDKKIQLSTKISAIQEIIADRVIWSQQLEALSSLTPINVWYDSIEVVDKNVTVRRPRINNRTGEPARDRDGNLIMMPVRVRMPFLQLKGFAATDVETGEASVYPLMQALEDDQAFSSRYEQDDVEFKKISDPEYGTLTQFTLDYRIKEK